MSDQTASPPPGSAEAKALGCMCPVLDNAHGRGTWGTYDAPDSEKLFVVRLDCPLHGGEPS